ncbi:MAG: monofunctional biosynthetic peptidoglycan transglycosylase [Betaproteobacteria bacterium]|nr:monofunctional biosynthetic peptidoglycan transglycosylase [Betaproteobacteria bacterium]
MKPLLRWLLLLLLAVLALQLFFVLRIATMALLAPQSSAFQRSEAWRLVSEKDQLKWRQQWVSYEKLSEHLKRAVIASEDDSFVGHDGIDWEALEKAWQKNNRAEAQAAKRATKPGKTGRVKVVGGSTITQQLAKNLFLSGERTLLRKGQEFVITLLLEAILSKQRILEIYLNSVEWGEGVFGAEAAAQHYFRKPAAELTPLEAARLAVMLPRPRYFEKLPNSGYLAERAAVIAERMPKAQLP